MTTIAAVVSDKRVFMAADSEASTDGERITLATPKIVRRGQYVIGVCGDPRMANIAHHMARLPAPPARGLARFMSDDFVEALAEAVEFAPGGGGHANASESGFLVGVHGRIWLIEDGWQVYEPAHKFAAVGSGGSCASAALFATRSLDWTPRRRLTMSLDAAVEFTTGSRRPYRYASTPTP
jgi:ATP-dependent protease HslVU (ClpYQ) peptidase subunit